MKYEYTGEIIPQEMRKEINQKIEYIVNHQLPESQTGISKTDIFNAYTGAGGLHGLKFKDYQNYHDYQEAKSGIEQGQFFTPYPLVEWIYNCLHVSKDDLIADLTSGHGAFISCVPVESNFYGCELDGNPYRVSKYLYPDAKLENTDIRFYEPGVTFDYIVGNPPYSLVMRKGNDAYSSEYYYCMKAAELLKPAGILSIIVPMSFCADDFSNKNMIEKMNESFNFICQVALDKNTFQHLGVINYGTKIVFFQKKSEYISEKPYSTEILSNVTADEVWEKYLRPVTEERKRIKNKILLEMIRNNKNEWNFRAEKLLYDIKRNPKTREHYAECCEYIQKYKTQKKPDCMNWDEWESYKIKPEDVMQHLKSALGLQNPKPDRNGRIIKNKNTLEYNGTSIPITDAVLQGCLQEPFCSRWTDRLIRKKKRAYDLQSIPFKEMKEDARIAEWLDDFSLTDEEETIRLNAMQKKDINRILQKTYGFIQWEQGCGKTLAGITIGEYRLIHNHIKNVFVVSTAIAIKNNWQDVLSQYGIDFILIENLSDIRRIKKGQFVLITLNMVCKWQKFLKRYIKSICQKGLLLLDESDNISNQDSKRTKAVLNVFRHLKYKTLMTGTSTRNHIAEIYPQMELLYNNSIHMLSECEYILKRNKDGELEETENDFYMQPYPAYHKGYKLFTESHIPEKITVFGVAQFTQDILHSNVLKQMIDKTIITRTFEQVTGRHLYEIKQVFCEMGEEEKRLYKIALNEFYKMEYLFSKTGNSRKDAMLKILNQLLALLKICAAPQTLKEYNPLIQPEKFRKVLLLLQEFSEERVAIGVRHIDVLKKYEQEIRKSFPDRPVFVITGNETTLSQRKKIIKSLKSTSNGILLSTQQSLSASMNIDFINKCIIPELHWNHSSMSQYYFRFIRYTSTQFKQVYFVTYENSIESNLLKMILAKDKLNLFMKDQDVTEDELYDHFGVEKYMLEQLMYKEKTEDGYVIRWGEQNIS